MNSTKHQNRHLLEQRFAANVRILRPTYGVLGEYFYIPPVDHILCGFVFERAKYASYIWRFAFPLFDKVEFLHLGFGERLASIEKTSSQEEVSLREAEKFLQVVEPYEAETSSWHELQNFLRFAEAPERGKNPWVQRGIALTHIMLGSALEATSQLSRLSKSAECRMLPHFQADIDCVQKELVKGIECAQLLLRKWETATRARFGLP